MNNMYDVIIVGAGPSGSSCARNLKRFYSSARVLLLDKAIFPRYKPCGGGVSPEVANYLDFDLLPAVNYVCQEVAMVANGKQVTASGYPLWMVRREEFDNYLLGKAKESGVEFLSGCEVLDINGSIDAGYQVQTDNQGSLSARLIVLAEGGRGKLAKKLGIAPHNNILAAMEYEHYTDNLDGRLYLDFDYNDSGYAWNFPKSDGLSLGIGGFLKGKARNGGLPGKLANYVKQFNVTELAKPNLHGHPIEIYSGQSRLVHNGIVLIGEIAGCVDPLTAEGIRPAIKSGYLAAGAISHALKENRLQLVYEYDRMFHQQIGKDFQRARVMSYLLNRYMPKILPMLASERAVKAVMQVFNGQSSYREKVNFKRIFKFMLKAIF